MDESVNVVFSNSFSDPLNALHMDILKIKVLGGVFSANEIIDHIRVSNALFERRCISEVIFHEYHPA